MAYKTDRLIDLFPDAYAARDRESLLYKLLDAAGAELMEADEAIKALLKSHWVNYASGSGLDGLGAIFGVARRRLPDGTLEPDNIFRLRLKSIVPLFTGGGTRRAVLGAVRSALGFPFDLSQLNLPAQFSGLRQDLENLVRLEEFTPHPQRLVADTASPADNGILTLAVPILGVRPEQARFEWSFTQGSGRRLRLELLPASVDTPLGGLQADDSLLILQGQTLRLSAAADGSLRAFLGASDVTSQFKALDGGAPRLPFVPVSEHRWRFSALSALFDSSFFDSETFGPPLYHVQVTWTSHEPLSFDVYVPYFLGAAVQNLKDQYGFKGEIFFYEGLDLKTIQDVVDQTRAAGVRGSVHFSLNFRDDHAQQESLLLAGLHQIGEQADLAEGELRVSSISTLADSHDASEHFAIGGVYDFSSFDGIFGFGG